MYCKQGMFRGEKFRIFCAWHCYRKTFMPEKWYYSSTCKCKCNTVKLFPRYKNTQVIHKTFPHETFPVYSSLPCITPTTHILIHAHNMHTHQVSIIKVLNPLTRSSQELAFLYIIKYMPKKRKHYKIGFHMHASI